MEEFDNRDQKEEVFSRAIRAGKRTYFFDVRAPRGNDYYLTITESHKRFDDNGYDRHKVFLYKEDFNKFIKALGEAMDYVKTELMPDFDFDAFNHDELPEEGISEGGVESEIILPVVEKAAETVNPEESEIIVPTGTNNEEVDKW